MYDFIDTNMCAILESPFREQFGGYLSQARKYYRFVIQLRVNEIVMKGVYAIDIVDQHWQGHGVSYFRLKNHKKFVLNDLNPETNLYRRWGEEIGSCNADLVDILNLNIKDKGFSLADFDGKETCKQYLDEILQKSLLTSM